MSDPSAFVEALQLENAALRQHIARLEKQQLVRRWPVTPAAARKHAEEALHASTAKLETLVQVSPLAITLLDTAGNVQLWNPAAEQIFGWTASEVIGQPNPIVPTSKQSE
jgi:PAS domain-containing protein